jgi:hypothetical protein
VIAHLAQAQRADRPPLDPLVGAKIDRGEAEADDSR